MAVASFAFKGSMKCRNPKSLAGSPVPCRTFWFNARASNCWCELMPICHDIWQVVTRRLSFVLWIKRLAFSCALCCNWKTQQTKHSVCKMRRLRYCFRCKLLHLPGPMHTQAYMYVQYIYIIYTYIHQCVDQVFEGWGVMGLPDNYQNKEYDCNCNYSGTNLWPSVAKKPQAKPSQNISLQSLTERSNKKHEHIIGRFQEIPPAVKNTQQNMK